MHTIKLTVGDVGVLSAAHATNPWSRFRGLMGRRTMPDGVEGMLFPRCSSLHTIGMRFPLDIVFLREGVVTQVARDVVPYRMVAGGRGVDALEVAAGSADRLGLAPGVRVSATAPGGGASASTRAALRGDG